MNMGKWNRHRLKNIINTNVNTYSPKENWEYVNYLDTGNITKNQITKIQYIDLRFEKLPSRARRKVQYNSIIYSTVRPNQLHYGIIKEQPEKFLVSTGFTVIDVDETKAIPDYIYYVLTQREVTEHLQAIGEQSVSAYPSIKPSNIEDLEIEIPSIEEQKKIVSILSVIDKKQRENQRINDNLYQLLALSFRYDYLESVTDEWLSVTLGDITSKFATGLNPRKNFVLGHGNNYYITIKNMGNNRIYLDNKCDKVDDEALIKINNRSNLQVGDLLFSGIGTIGRTYLLHKPANNWNISESVFTLRPDDRTSSEFIYLLLLSDDMQSYAINNSQGSVQKGIRMADLKRYPVLLPPKSVMENLTSLWKPLIEKIKANEDEGDRLSVLRDTLLPKLMSGEIDVSTI